jgi:DNA-binding NarL/FixJ family response regulator
MGETIQIVLVDDHPMFRDGVVHTLSSELDIEVVAQGSTARDAIRLAMELLPDIILLDITMPGSGIEAARGIATSCPVTKIVMLTGSEDEEHLLAALKAGARGYILKGIAGRELVRILRTVHVGDVYVTPSLAASLLVEMSAGVPGPRSAANRIGDLTEREHQILEYVAAGKSNKEIGQQLFLSEKTIKHYMTNILQKLQVRNRVEAALLAQKGQKAGSF